MSHTRQETRANNWKHAIRKRRLAHEVDGVTYDNLHQYHNNKIHCSCYMCRGELWSVGKNSIQQQTITNQKKLNKMKSQLDEIDAEI